MTNPYLFGVSETWLNDSISNQQIANEDEYLVVRKDRGEQKGGGVMLIVKKELRPDHRKDLEPKSTTHNELIIVEIEPSKGNGYAVIVAYRSQQDPFPLFLANYDECMLDKKEGTGKNGGKREVLNME